MIIMISTNCEKDSLLEKPFSLGSHDNFFLKREIILLIFFLTIAAIHISENIIIYVNH